MSATPDCPLCLQNNLMSEPIIAETNGAYLVNARGSEGNFLIIPKGHAEDPSDLPDDWWAHVKQLFVQTPTDKTHYNLSLNVGRNSGQTVKHLHFWVIPRKGDTPSAGRGLATLITAADQALKT